MKNKYSYIQRFATEVAVMFIVRAQKVNPSTQNSLGVRVQEQLFPIIDKGLVVLRKHRQKEIKNITNQELFENWSINYMWGHLPLANARKPPQ